MFLATSAIHREHKLNMAKDEILKAAIEGVRLARSLAADVEFSPEDASRTELEFLAQVVEAAIETGQSLCDAVGGCCGGCGGDATVVMAGQRAPTVAGAACMT